MMRTNLETITAVWVLIGIVMLAAVLAVMLQSPVLAQGPTPTPTPGPNDCFGLNNVCSWMIRDGYYRQNREGIREYPEDDINTRYQYARDADVGWTRWVFEWSKVEKQEGIYDFNSMDPVVEKDIANGLKILAILKNTPAYKPDSSFYRTLEKCKSNEGCPPQNLDELVFNCNSPKITSDNCANSGGVDRDDPININNYWARFVYEIVEHYKPGGVLAGQHTEWPEGAGIRHWEIWNEPDGLEWAGAGGNVDEFYRLLQVAYLTVHYTDPEAKVLLAAFKDGWNCPFADLLTHRFATFYKGVSLRAKRSNLLQEIS